MIFKTNVTSVAFFLYDHPTRNCQRLDSIAKRFPTRNIATERRSSKRNFFSQFFLNVCSVPTSGLNTITKASTCCFLSLCRSFALRSLCIGNFQPRLVCFIIPLRVSRKPIKSPMGGSINAAGDISGICATPASIYPPPVEGGDALTVEMQAPPPFPPPPRGGAYRES